MIRVLGPVEDDLARALSKMESAEVTYTETGATSGDLPVGYRYERVTHRFLDGLEVAQAALRAMNITVSPGQSQKRPVGVRATRSCRSSSTNSSSRSPKRWGAA